MPERIFRQIRPRLGIYVAHHHEAERRQAIVIERQSLAARLREEVGKALADPELQRQFQAAGVEAATLEPTALDAFVRAEFEKWGRVVRDTGAKVN